MGMAEEMTYIQNIVQKNGSYECFIYPQLDLWETGVYG